MWEELRLLREDEHDELQSIRLKRVSFIIKCCLMIAYLNGEAV